MKTGSRVAAVLSCLVGILVVTKALLTTNIKRRGIGSVPPRTRYLDEILLQSKPRTTRLQANQRFATGDNDDDELFSVAPMMGHTNRHYRYFFRLLSSRSHLYTEMIPASQIWSAYRRARDLYCTTTPSGSRAKEFPPPEEIWEVLRMVHRDPSKEYRAAAQAGDRLPTLHQLLATSSCGEHPVVLQLGGNDPTNLAAGAAIGAAWGMVESSSSSSSSSVYSSINLNCGCPSNAVGGRSGGCALMGTPDLVARSVEAMKASIDNLWDDDSNSQQQTPSVTVKHRLGIRQASTFDAAADRLKNDDEAFEDAASFVRTVSLAGAVPKFHVHTRLGLLGDFADEDGDDNGDDNGDTDGSTKRSQTLWVPGVTTTKTTTENDKRIKIDHKREQEKAKRQSRRATIKNREVPPLRPNVVPRLADAFPHLLFVANGGMDDLEAAKRIVDDTEHPNLVGAMIGRTVINHPCSFAKADRLLWGDDTNSAAAAAAPATRGEVLSSYIDYCETEESLLESYGAGRDQLETLRKKLIAVPFHLFVGEPGSDAFQRKILKLREKSTGKRPMKAASILRVAASFVDAASLEKSVEDYVPWENVAKFEVGLKRGSALQKVVY